MYNSPQCLRLAEYASDDPRVCKPLMARSLHYNVMRACECVSMLCVCVCVVCVCSRHAFDHLYMLIIVAMCMLTSMHGEVF